MDYFISKTKHLKHEKPHQYERIRIKDGSVVFILYNSGSLVYEDNAQTNDFLKDNLDELFDEKKACGKKTHNHTTQHTNKKNYKKRFYKKSDEKTFKQNEYDFDNYNVSLSDYEYTIGSDETGKGEWFGPLVVCATATSKDENIKLKEIGVKDSKKLDKKQIKKLYEKIEQLNIKHEVIILRPFSYNKLYNKFRQEDKNLNHLLAYLHSKVIKQLLNEINSNDTLIIIDKFDIKKMNEYLNTSANVIQEENGEKYTPVATSSIIAKYHYEKVLNQLEQRYNIKLNKKTKIKNIDKNILDKVAKTHFKNINRYL